MTNLPATNPVTSNNSISTALPAMPKVDTSALPDLKLNSYSLPAQASLAPVSKPSFSDYFDQNIKPVFQKTLNEQMAANSPLVQQYAQTFQRDVKPLTDQLNQSIYGRNVGATSGLGANAAALGLQKIMQPITDYTNTLNGNTITNANNTLNSMLSSGFNNEASANNQNYATNQQNLFNQMNTQNQNALNMATANTDLANKGMQAQYDAQLNATKAAYDDAIRRGDATQANQLAIQLQNNQATNTTANNAQLSQLQMEQQKNLQQLNQQTTNNANLLKLALDGKLGSQGASVIAGQLGLDQSHVDALLATPRNDLIQSTVSQMVANNQPVSLDALNALLAAGGKPQLTDAEKASLQPAMTLPPSNAASKMLNNENGQVKGILADKYGFRRDIGGGQWKMDFPENITKFNQLYATDPEFRSFVQSNI